MEDAFQERLKTLRKERGLTQEGLAVSCGLSQAMISGLESGKYDINNTTGWLIANCLNMTYSELLGETGLHHLIYGLLLDRFCTNHDEVLLLPSFSLGGENKFCPECGDETIGECPECQTHLDKRLNEFCYVCGYNLKQLYPEIEDEGGVWDSIEEAKRHLDEDVYRVVLGLDQKLTHMGPIKICFTAHTERRFKLKVVDNNIDILQEETVEVEIQYKWPAQGLLGPMNFCPDCGIELLEACPQCEKPFELFVTEHKNQYLKIKFCTGCGFDFSKHTSSHSHE